MALTPETAQAGVVSALKAVSGIGQVHHYRRRVTNEASVTALLVVPTATGNLINGWFVAPGSPPITNVKRGIGSGITGTLQFSVEGHYGISDADASENQFRDLCWSVFKKLDAFVLLQPDASTNEASWDVMGYIAYAGLMPLHYAKFTVGIWGRLVLP